MRNVYVDSDNQGTITAVYARPQRRGHESVKHDDPQVVTFLSPNMLTVEDEYEKNEWIKALVTALSRGPATKADVVAEVKKVRGV